jgi:hypothetical protein
MPKWSRNGFFMMTIIGSTIVVPQLPELIDVFHTTVMENSSDLVDDE